MYKLWLKRFISAAITLYLIPISAQGSVEHPCETARSIVLVHGALIDGSAWQNVYSLLTDKGYKVSVVQQPLTSFKDDVAAVNRILAQQEGAVVLVGHSYAGAVISVAGNAAKVKALVYVAAFQPDTGETMGQLSTLMPAATNDLQMTEDGFLFMNKSKFAESYAADLPVSQSNFMAIAQTPVAASIFSTPLPTVAWHIKPSYGIVATEDRGLNPDLERWMYKRSSADVTEVKASHAVLISQPTVVANVIDKAAVQCLNSTRK